jgi:tryptophan-rich sensory protein
LVWNRIKAREALKKALLSLQFNWHALWSYLFFGLQNPMLAGLEIIVLWLMIFETYVQFAKLIRLQGCLFRIWRG